ncbi:hypothetical protein [Angelakisella massiliensis]|uniref:hypothetical protein n=1 Tax=Angelakisella massiliensis TaxID=1871018 RepID=UPI0023A9023E|nr:hypothetical protein [Angelakisella massiliensis]
MLFNYINDPWQTESKTDLFGGIFSLPKERLAAYCFQGRFSKPDPKTEQSFLEPKV